MLWLQEVEEGENAKHDLIPARTLLHKRATTLPTDIGASLSPTQFSGFATPEVMIICFKEKKLERPQNMCVMANIRF